MLKRIAKKIILNFGLLNVKRCFLPKTALILYYHSVVHDPREYGDHINPGIAIGTKLFREQMQLLRKKYHPVTVEEIRRWIVDGVDLPPRSVAVTFDDGFADNFTVAAPVMEELGIRGGFYLTANSVDNQTLPWFCKIHYLFEKWKASGKKFTDTENRLWSVDEPVKYAEAYRHFGYPCARVSLEGQEMRIAKLESLLGIRYDASNAPKMMTWNNANDLARRGHLIGNHTFSHPNVAQLTSEDQKSEIERSQALLRKHMECSVEHFSYPHPCLNPQWDKTSQELIRETGYKSIVLTEPGWVTRNSSPLQLSRVTIGSWPLDVFSWKIETAFAGINT